MKPTPKKPRRKQASLYKLPLVLDPQPEGGFIVTCPLLPELITEGDSVEESLANVQDALAALIEAYKTLRRPLPSVLRQDVIKTPLWFEAVVSV